MLQSYANQCTQVHVVCSSEHRDHLPDVSATAAACQNNCPLGV